MEEIWKDIPWYEGLYQISNLGSVKSFLHKKVKVLKNRICHKYLFVILYGKKKNNFAVHRLVAQAFLWLDINNSKMFVCHKDDNPWNNCVDNLFLWTAKDNSMDCINKWRHYWQWKLWWLHFNSKKVWQYYLNWELVKIWDSQSDIYRTLWLNQRNISSCCNWKRNKCGGFIWKHINYEE